jgi:hypothetical protein
LTIHCAERGGKVDIENKRDLSVSLVRANVIVLLFGTPVACLQFILFYALHGMGIITLVWHIILFGALVLAGIVAHEFIHGLAWMYFGKKSTSAITFGIQWKYLTPYAHLKEPVDINAYRIGAFMPGFILGIVPYVVSLFTGNSMLLWFSIINTAAAGGDWLILWILRAVQGETLVEDHPTNAGCYIITS